MDKLFKKRNFFSDNITEKSDAKPQMHQEIYYEGQNISGRNVKEEQDVIMNEKKKGRFFANYNMFF
ncbi:MAG: hypothetical protein LBF05_03995 [Tannerella sp.]|nr:hypothetical protein [Tannerella sp.]